MSGPDAADRAVKRRRVLDVLDARGADSVVLRSHTAVAWYLDGARTHVSLAGDPIAAVVVRRDGDELRVFDNEADRLLAEELGGSATGSRSRACRGTTSWFPTASASSMRPTSPPSCAPPARACCRPSSPAIARCAARSPRR